MVVESCCLAKIRKSDISETDFVWFRLTFKSHRKLIKMNFFFGFLSLFYHLWVYSLSGRCQKIPQFMVLIEKQLLNLDREIRHSKYLFLVGLKGLQSKYLDLEEMWGISRFPILKLWTRVLGHAKLISVNSFGAQRVWSRRGCPRGDIQGLYIHNLNVSSF